MTPDQYRVVQEIFLAVCDLPSDTQEDVLNARSRDDPYVRSIVRSLLAMDAQRPGLFESDRVNSFVMKMVAEALTAPSTPEFGSTPAQRRGDSAD